MTIALSVPVEEDLLPLSALLRQRGVVHRIFEDGGRQVLAVQGGEQQAQQVASLYRAWRSGELQIELTEQRVPKVAAGRSLQWRSAPVTALLVLCSVAGFLLVYLGAPLKLLGLFTFTPFEIADGQLRFGSMGQQYWRLLTPAFLHFGWLHIVFNCLWLWELGTRVERATGSVNMIGLFVVIALVSNASQYLFGGPGLFGGMSGVVYGLLGFAWVAPLVQPRWNIQPPRAIMLFMVGWLLACMIGLVEVLGFGSIANAAHLGGLLCGALLGLVLGAMSRSTGGSNE